MWKSLQLAGPKECLGIGGDGVLGNAINLNQKSSNILMPGRSNVIECGRISHWLCR
ncbi:unnamed protein product [Penicillium camemberti]|uniref:Str. FM013 n=1 Tax=Penicillium camemberti (strain FM 013) TaxID=1429867 RepID=A0A0G4PLX0_PENC3|nr:unnamed protein product [Penicillium camemberti]